MIIEPYAGPGGWDIAARTLGLDPIGIELDADACATRSAAGLTTIRADLTTYPKPWHLTDRLTGLIASPPCPAFSASGKRHGEALVDVLVQEVHDQHWSARPDPDPLVWLTLDLGWWITLYPEWICLEQVPAVLPIWRAYAHHLDEAGYSTWTGILNAADYGVPQTRRRAILIASRTRTVTPPAPTHAETPTPTLFGDELAPWVSMADALGWTGDGRGGFPRADDLGTSEDGYRERDWRTIDEPAFTVTEKARSWTLNTGLDWKPGGTREDAQTIDITERPSPALTSRSGSQWHIRRLGDHAHERYSDRAGTDAIRITPTDALILQSFPHDYPLAGTRTSQFQQVGNAIPPLLAWHILQSAIDPCV